MFICPRFLESQYLFDIRSMDYNNLKVNKQNKKKL